MRLAWTAFDWCVRRLGQIELETNEIKICSAWCATITANPWRGKHKMHCNLIGFLNSWLNRRPRCIRQFPPTYIKVYTKIKYAAIHLRAFDDNFLCRGRISAKYTSFQKTRNYSFVLVLITKFSSIFSADTCVFYCGATLWGPHPWKHLVNRFDSFPFNVKNSFLGLSGCLTRRCCM